MAQISPRGLTIAGRISGVAGHMGEVKTLVHDVQNRDNETGLQHM